MTDRPIAFVWQGDSFTPANPFWQGQCDKAFVVHERYYLVEHSERSKISHDHYFAALTEIWKNLPERYAEKFPDVETLRKTGLIRTGYRNERQFIAASNDEAIRLAAFMRRADSFAIYSVNDDTVIEWTAKSQSYRAMGKDDFQASKDAVLGWASDLIGVSPAQARNNAEMVA